MARRYGTSSRPDTRQRSFKPDVLSWQIGERVPWDRSRQEVLEVTLPFLRSIEPIDDLLQVARDPRNPCSTNDYILFYVELAAGHFDAALEILERCRNQWLHDKDYHLSWRDVSEDMRLRQMERLLLSRSHDRIGKALRHREERCAHRRGYGTSGNHRPFRSSRAMTTGCAR